MSTVQLAFYKGKDHLFNRLVSWWTRGPYSHCEFVAGVNEDGSAVCWSSSFLDGGVRKKSIFLHQDRWDIVDIPLDQDIFNEALKWFEEHRGDPYDLVGLLGFVVGSIPDNKAKWFCSEAVARALGFEESWRFCPNTLRVVVKRLS